MADRINLRSFVTIAVVVGVVGIGAATTSWQPSMPWSGTAVTEDERPPARQSPSRPAALGESGIRLSSGTSAGLLELPPYEFEGLPPVFTPIAVEARADASSFNRDSSPLWGSEPSRRASASSRSRAGRVGSAAGGAGGVGFSAGSRSGSASRSSDRPAASERGNRTSSGNSGTSSNNSAGSSSSGSAGGASGGSGGGSSSSSGGGSSSEASSGGIFGEQTTPIGSLSIDPDAQAGLIGGDQGGSLTPSVGGMSPTPEPGSLLLIGTGLGLLGALRRRRLV